MSAGSLVKALFGLLFDDAQCRGSKGKDNGFGSNYVWAGSLESGLQIASNHKKPVMVIIHKSWCTACKKLKPKFADSSDIQRLSRHFVMINLADEDEPPSVTYQPDGNYIPRILFLSPDGSVDYTMFNEEGSRQHKYFYSRPDQIARSMRKALEKYAAEKFDLQWISPNGDRWKRRCELYLHKLATSRSGEKKRCDRQQRRFSAFISTNILRSPHAAGLGTIAMEL